MPAPFATPHAPVPLPALYLYPLNDSFVPKHISLVSNQRVKIGRQTNAKTVPAERNGYFDSKVLSRQHAEVWEEGGKIFIKDVKSSNGTFINGERLSPEGLESDPFELKSDDIVEFGIDIVGEDNKTIIHHKVAARVVCVFTDQDAQTAARYEAAQNPPSYGSVTGQSPAAAAFNFSGGQQPGVNGAPGQQRRPSIQQGLIGMGGMGGSVRPPGKSGLTFDHILTRLQGELQKSRETGAELHSLTGAMNDIHDTLGGNLPPNLPPYPSTLPPVVPPQSQQQQESGHQQAPPPDSGSALTELQSQLHETQLSLASHVEKILALEGMLAEHDAIKREVSAMRELMEERKHESEVSRRHSGSPTRIRHHESHQEESHDDQYMSDDDDTRSISTIVPHELERVDEEDEEQLAAEEEEEERRRRRDELGRPRTPEPTGMGMHEDDDEQEHRHRRTDRQMRSRSPSPSPAPTPAPAPAPLSDDLSQRLTALSKQLETALELSRSLEAQHSVAQSTIIMLESKVTALETLVRDTQSQVQVQAEAQQQLADVVSKDLSRSSAPPGEDDRLRERDSLTEMMNEWKKGVEGRWSGVQEEWTEERDRLRRAREEWENRVRVVEDSLGNAVSKMESGFAAMQAGRSQESYMNGNAKLNHSGGLVTPPSPRSLSAESTRPRQRRRRASSSRGRSRSRSASTGASIEVHAGSSAASSMSGEVRVQDPFSSPNARRRSPWTMDDSSASDSEIIPAPDHPGNVGKELEQNVKGMPFPITPESSVLNHPLTSSDDVSGAATDSRTKEPAKDLPQFHNLSTAVGVLVLSVAAAAVLWRVKPEGSL